MRRWRQNYGRRDRRRVGEEEAKKKEGGKSDVSVFSPTHSGENGI